MSDVHGTFVERGTGVSWRAMPWSWRTSTARLGVEAFARHGRPAPHLSPRARDGSRLRHVLRYGRTRRTSPPPRSTLVNRITQIYEDETSIRMVLVASNDLLNLNTARSRRARTVRAGPPPASRPAHVSSTAAADCSTATGSSSARSSARATTTSVTSRWASPAAGWPRLGVVGRRREGPGLHGARRRRSGDFFAVDYVAHEMGHQFAGNHTFNGNQHNCRRNRSGEGRRSSRGADPRSWPTRGSAGRTTCSPTATRTGRSGASTRSRPTSRRTRRRSTRCRTCPCGTSTAPSRSSSRTTAASPRVIARGTELHPAGIKAAIQGIPGVARGRDRHRHGLRRRRDARRHRLPGHVRWHAGAGRRSARSACRP